MRIENIVIDRFGSHTGVRLAELSNRINVIFGEEGSGKSTTMAFVRWMLFGNCDEDIDRYLRSTVGPATGSLTVFHDGLRRTISRQDDGTRYGLLAVDGGGHFTQQTNHMVSLLGDLGLHDYDALYACRHVLDIDMSAILRAAQSRGLSLTGRRLPHPRVPEIRLKIDNLRRDMERLPWRASDVHTLHEQRRSLEARLAILEEEYRRRRSDYDREYEQLRVTISDLELELTRIRQQWHERDDLAQERRRELEDAWRAADEAKQEFLRRRRDELSSIESSISRARSMQADVRNRFERVDRLVRDVEHDHAQVSPSPQTACLVNSIAQQLDVLRRQPSLAYDPVAGRYRPVRPSGSAEASTIAAHMEDKYRSVYQPVAAASALSGSENYTFQNMAPGLDPDLPSIHQLREQVGRLCRTLQENESQKLASELTAELHQLQQCDSSMEQWIASLSKQRDTVAAELERAQLHGVSLIADTPDGDLWSHRGRVSGAFRSPERIKAVPHACDAYEPIEPEDDVCLRRLVGDRDAIQRDVESHERQLRQLIDRRRELEAAISRVTDLELEGVRRQIGELESLIRAAEERERMLREIASLEAELRRHQDDVQPSEVLQHAGEFLRRVSGNRLLTIRVDGGGGLFVEDEAGCAFVYSELALPNQQLVALSMTLAIIHAYRSRGMELPLVLTDRWFLSQADQGQALSAAIADFAEAGNQVILFTKYRHLIGLLQPFRPRIFEMQSNIPATITRTAVESPSADAVRFRPRVTEPTTPYLRGRRSDRDNQRANNASSRSDVQDAPIVTGRGDSTRFAPSTRGAARSDGVQVVFGNGAEPSVTGAAYPSSRVYPSAVGTAQSNQLSQIYDPAGGIGSTVAGDLRNEYRSPMEASPTYVAGSSVTSPDAGRVEPALTLSRSTLLANSQTIDSDVVSRLREMSILTVDEFLNASPAAVDRELQHWKLGVRPVRRWQDELLLRCNIGNLNAFDARLLVASGVADVQTLADCEFDSLVQRLRRVLELRGAHGALETNSQRVENWIQDARRRMSTRRAVGPVASLTRGTEAVNNPAGSDSSPAASLDAATKPRPTKSPSEYLRGWRDAPKQRAPRRRRRKVTGTEGQMPTPDQRVAERVRRERQQEEAARLGALSANSQNERHEPLKFYLNRQSPIVDAPSIGPRTAERLQSVGIHTIHDLLRAAPDALATKLDYNRVGPDTIREWQAQTVLACRIPMLRGHDAQILVACGITTPERVMGMNVDQLWAIVGPFTETTECKRIIRNGRMPNRDEIHEWILWASRARAIEAA